MTHYVYVVQASIAAEYQQIFDELYDSEHVAHLLTVPGVRSCTRFELEWSEPEMARYLTIYEVDHPEVPHSEEWKAASSKGDWAVKVRPHLTVRLHGMYKSVVQHLTGADALPFDRVARGDSMPTEPRKHQP